MPEKALMAMITVALRWQLPHVALLLATGFVGLLRVHELRWLRFGSFLTPSRLLADGGPMFVVIEKPKMWRIAARRAYTRIGDPAVVALAEALVGRFRADDLVFSGSYAELHDVFAAILAELGLPAGGPTGLGLSSLRPGGATWLYRQTDNSELVRFRGRWASLRMLEIYIQEVGALSVIPRLPPPTRQRLVDLAAYAPTAIANTVYELTR